MVKLWAKLSPYELTTILAPTDAVCKLMSVSEFKDSTASQNFHGTGKMITPLGANLIHTPFAGENTVIALDKNCALEMVEAGQIITDYDKLIDRQLERATISCIAGFAKIFDSASVKLSY